MKNLIEYDFFLVEKWFGSSKSEYRREKERIWNNQFASYSDKFQDFNNLINLYLSKNPDAAFKNEMEQDLNYSSLMMDSLGKPKLEKTIRIYKAIKDPKLNLSTKQRQKLHDMLPKFKNK